MSLGESITTTVLPGQRIEVAVPAFPVGQWEVRFDRLFRFTSPWPPDFLDLGRIRAAFPVGARLVGSLALPSSGTVFFDTQIAIYAVERHPVYASLIRPLWLAGQAGTIGCALATSRPSNTTIRCGDLASLTSDPSPNLSCEWRRNCARDTSPSVPLMGFMPRPRSLRGQLFWSPMTTTFAR
jgi:hypothetical protein